MKAEALKLKVRMCEYSSYITIIKLPALYIYTGIRVTGHESSLPLESSASLNCTTDLAVNTIEWLDMQGRVLENGTDSLLELTVTLTDISSLEYTCRVKSEFGVQNETATLSILSEATSPSVVSNAIPAVIAIIMLAVLILAVVAVIVIVR